MTSEATRPLAPFEYQELVRRVRDAVEALAPVGSTVAVVSKGDEELLGFYGLRGWHFPRAESGVYAGYYPADSAAILEHVEELRELGAEYLVFPASAFWWFEQYEGLGERLESSYPLLTRHDDCCAVYSLAEQAPGRAAAPASGGQPSATERQLSGLIDNLLPGGIAVAVAGLEAGQASALGNRQALDFPLDATAEPAHAIARLDGLRANGAHFLIIPSRAYDWLEAHPEFARHLHQQYRFVTRQQHVCEIYELAAPPDEGRRGGAVPLPAARQSAQAQAIASRPKSPSRLRRLRERLSPRAGRR